jgi:hypothetical protein
MPSVPFCVQPWYRSMNSDPSRISGCSRWTTVPALIDSIATIPFPFPANFRISNIASPVNWTRLQKTSQIVAHNFLPSFRNHLIQV